MEEPFNETDKEVLGKIYAKHIKSYWISQFGIILIAIVGPFFARRDRGFFIDQIEYKYEVLTSLLIMSGLLLFYFYQSKYDLRKDIKGRTKELLSFEVLNKERFFEEKAFYVFIDDYRKEEVSKALYETLSVGDEVSYYQAKYSKERLSELFKYN